MEGIDLAIRFGYPQNSSSDCAPIASDAHSDGGRSGLSRTLRSASHLRPARPGDAASVVDGQLPHTLFEEIRRKFIAAIKARRAGVVPRSA